MKLNEKLVLLYKSAADRIRSTETYRKHRKSFEDELSARCSKGDTTPFRIGNIDPETRTVLVRDLCDEGLYVVVNGHAVEASVILPDVA